MGKGNAESARAEGGTVMADEKKIPLGKPLPLTALDLADAAIITAEDIEKAKKLWRENAPDKFIDLLDAEFIEEDE